MNSTKCILRSFCFVHLFKDHYITPEEKPTFRPLPLCTMRDCLITVVQYHSVIYCPCQHIDSPKPFQQGYRFLDFLQTFISDILPPHSEPLQLYWITKFCFINVWSVFYLSIFQTKLYIYRIFNFVSI